MTTNGGSVFECVAGRRTMRRRSRRARYREMGRRAVLPTQPQRRLMGNLIVGGMVIQKSGWVAWLLGPEPGREYLARVSAATFDQMLANRWLKPVGENRWTISRKGKRIFDTGKIR